MNRREYIGLFAGTGLTAMLVKADDSVSSSPTPTPTPTTMSTADGGPTSSGSTESTATPTPAEEAPAYIRVSDYGGDSAALRRAIDAAAAGQTVIVDRLAEADPHIWDERLTIGKRVEIRIESDVRVADGVVSSAGEAVLRVVVPGVRVVGGAGRIDGNGANNTGRLLSFDGRPRFDDKNGTLGAATGLTVIDAPRGAAIGAGGSHGTIITENTIVDPYKHGVTVGNHGSRGVVVANNTCLNPAGRENGYMLYVLSSAIGTVVEGNTVRGGPGTAQGISADDGHRGTRMADNVIVGDFTRHSAVLDPGTDVSFVNNTIRDNSLTDALRTEGLGEGVLIEGNSIARIASHGIRVRNGARPVVRDNYIRETGVEQSGTIGYGIEIDDVDDAVVADNVIVDAYDTGIKLSANGAHGRVSAIIRDNQIFSPDSVTARGIEANESSVTAGNTVGDGVGG